MIEECIGPGPYYDCVAVGNVLTIAGGAYDLDELQGDSQEIINIIENGCFLANIVIPPATYETVIVDDEEAIVQQPVLLARVRVVFWTKIEETN